VELGIALGTALGAVPSYTGWRSGQHWRSTGRTTATHQDNTGGNTSVPHR
jgi:hypothetical protein